MKVSIYSRKEMETLISRDEIENTAIISFYDPIGRGRRYLEDYAPIDFSDKSDRVVQIAIHDLDPEALSDFGLSVEAYFPEADTLAEFIYKAKEDGLDIICQCEYGQSRSAGCAAAILQHFSKNGIDVFADYRYYPNQLVYHKVFDALEKYPNVMAVRHDRCVYQNLDHVTDEFCAQFELDPFYLYTPAVNATFIDHFGETCRKMEGVEMVSVYFRNVRERELLLAELDATGQLGYARHSERPYCEIFAKNAGKGNGVKGLMAWLNCERERVICVGDGVNDLPMVRAAGLGLAVSNACPQLLAEADAVICSNEEHVMPYILKHCVLNA